MSYLENCDTFFTENNFYYKWDVQITNIKHAIIYNMLQNLLKIKQAAIR